MTISSTYNAVNDYAVIRLGKYGFIPLGVEKTGIKLENVNVTGGRQVIAVNAPAVSLSANLGCGVMLTIDKTNPLGKAFLATCNAFLLYLSKTSKQGNIANTLTDKQVAFLQTTADIDGATGDAKFDKLSKEDYTKEGIICAIFTNAIAVPSAYLSSITITDNKEQPTQANVDIQMERSVEPYTDLYGLTNLFRLGVL